MANNLSRASARILQLERLRRDIREGLYSGPAQPWSSAKMKRQGRKHLAARKAAAG
jgi:hypothetical protein